MNHRIAHAPCLIGRRTVPIGRLALALLALTVSSLLAAPFSPPSVVWSGSTDYRHLFVADINNDTLPDLAVISGGTNLLWFVNTGGGNFTASHSLGVSGWNIATAQTADLDGDGDADVILVLRKNSDFYGIGQMAVFRNNGSSGFTNVQQFATGGFPAYGQPTPIIADLDNDGDLDVAYIYCPNLKDGVLVWRSNNGSGILGNPVTLDTTTNSTDLYWGTSMNAVDFNGDGKTDLVVTCSQNGITGNTQSVIRSYTGIAQGTFSAALRTLVPFGRAGKTFLADLNRDGRPDLISTDGSFSKEVWLRLGTGSGFGSETSLASTTGAFSENISAGDLDGDGDPDIVLTETINGAHRLTWLRNNGAGQFQSPAILTTGLSSAGRATRVLDVDGDGDADIAILTQNGLEIALNQSIRRTVEPAFTDVNRASALNGGPRLVTADFDRDGDVDIAVLSPEDGTVRWLPSQGSALGAEITISTAAAGATAMAAGDVTGDGLPDIVIGMPALGQIHLLRNVGNGATWQTTVLPALASVHAIAIADGDADGSLDVIAFSRTTYKTVLFRNVNRDGTTWTQEQVASLAAVDRVEAVQLVKPGRPEFLLTTYDPEVGIAQVYRSLWSGGAWNTALLAQGNGGSSVVVAGDLNGDGSHDLLRSLGYGAGWQPNYNNGAFNPAQPIPQLPEGQRSGTLADLNGDGRPDLITAGSGKVLACLNLGQGAFAPPLTLFTAGAGEEFRDLAVFDFERDGDLDIAIADASADRVRILINRGGQYDTASTAPQSGQSAWGAEEKTLIHSTVSHLGAPEDASLIVKNFRLRLQRAVAQNNGSFTAGSALTAAEATSLLEKIEICRDLGTPGTYEPGTDTVVATLTSFDSIQDGYLTLTTSAGAHALASAGPAQSISFWVRATSRAAAGSSAVKHLTATLVLQEGGSLIAHQGATPDWPLRKRGGSGNISAVLGFTQPTALQSWRFANFGTYENTGHAANHADPDGDGNATIVEYVMNQNPNAPGGLGSSSPIGMTHQSGNLLLDLRLLTTYDSKVKLTLQYTANPTNGWSLLSTRTGTGPWTGIVPTSLTLQGGRTRWTFDGGFATAIFPSMFFRLLAEELP